MTPLDILFIVANAILTFGTLLLIVSAVKNRNVLKGFSSPGSILTVIPCAVFLICYAMMGNWIAFVLSAITSLFWLLVVVFLLKNKFTKKTCEDCDLIAVVEKLGKKADGRFAELAVVEIPDVEYTIEEYDGSEHIAEKHRTWG